MNKFNPPVDFNKIRVGFDLETYPFGYFEERPSNPPTIVASVCIPEEDTHFLMKPDSENYIPMLKEILSEGYLIVGQNIGFDMVCTALDFPELVPLIFDKYERGEIADTMYIEMMINLSKIGIIKGGDRKSDYFRGEFVPRIMYGLDSLAMDYLGLDLSAEKKDPLAWRTRYNELVDVPLEEWPEKASSYAMGDSDIPLRVLQAQLTVCPRGALDALARKLQDDFALKLKSTVGIHTDQVEVAKVREQVLSEFTDEKLAKLISTGIYLKGSDPKPYKNGSLDHSQCIYPKDSKEQKKKLCDCPAKMSAATTPSMKEKPLKDHVIKLIGEGKFTREDLLISDAGVKDNAFMDRWKRNDCDLVELFNDSREKEVEFKGVTKLRNQPYYKYLSLANEFQEGYKNLDFEDDILQEYLHYQKWNKMKTTELPRLENEVLYPGYEALKETGRTSSKDGGKVNKVRVYPSMNIQQITAGIRQCYIPKVGHYMLSCDFKAMELVTAAQTCLNLFGFSKLAEKINAGYYTHAYLGSQIALKFSPEFSSILEEDPSLIDRPDEVYEMFLTLKDIPEYKKLFKLFRTLAKPTGLGYWGGLGPKTWVTTAETIYYVDVEGIAKDLYGEEGHEEDMAKALKEIWHNTFPESRLYFEHITKTHADHNASYQYWHEEEGRKKTRQKFKYKTHYGLQRSNCDYCVIMNGVALQSPGAEGALTCNWIVTREAFDPTQNSVLFEHYRDYGFIHDEFLGDVTIGMEYLVAKRICEIMHEFYKEVCPDVRSDGDPALMEFWSKEAESIMNHETKTVTLWKPKVEK